MKNGTDEYSKTLRHENRCANSRASGGVDMNKVVWLLCILNCFYVAAKSQNKSGYSWIFGSGGIYAQFNGDTSKPITNELYPSFTLPQGPYYFDGGSSCICDSNTGRILFACNGGVVYDTLGNKIDNGDSLIPYKIYTHNAFPVLAETQATLILPKGSNKLYYIFASTITDSLYNYLDSTNAQIWPYDLLQYHVIDMTANSGSGKVVQKNLPLIEHTLLNKVGMMACRHANGSDWWLLKNGGYDSMVVYKVLVTADTSQLIDSQSFGAIKFGPADLKGQSCFSHNGKRYAYAMGKANKLFLADFDRCSGELRNHRVINVPIDSTRHPGDASQHRLDSLIRGVCFSSNDSFIYITRAYNIYQYELYNPDSTTAWYHVQYGPDTVLQYFGGYGQMNRGIDDRIYIGHAGGGSFQGLGVINKPNLKGVNCYFKGGQLKYTQSIYSHSSPANMPDFTLVADSSGCWPLSNEQLTINNEQWAFYPNPVNAILYIKNAKGKGKKLYNLYGQLLISTTKEEIDISGLAKGLYFLSCEQQTQKVLVE